MNVTKVYSAGIFAAAALFASGCFNPDLTGVVFKCDDINNTQCPAGQVCLEGNCVTTDIIGGGPTDDGGTGSADLAGTVPSVTGCAAGGGNDVSKGQSKLVYTCAGTFDSTFNTSRNINRLCATGYELCTKADNIDMNKCSQEPSGFFMARVITQRDNMMASKNGCGSPGKNQGPMWAGCGASLSYVVPLASSCSNFTKAWDCGYSQTTGDTQLDCYNFGGYSPEASASKRADHGALCCKK